MAQILAGIEHIVVVMLENRSLDNMLGTLYADGSRPVQVLPAGSAGEFDGVHSGLPNPSNAGYFNGDPPQNVAVVTAAASSTVPDPDPEETFTNVTYQIFGPEAPGSVPRWPMQGFVVNYAQTGAANAAQIMQCHSPEQVPVLAMLARSYAVHVADFFERHPARTR
ncbi:MAG TPA: alkaline phosphatase family protein [Steroidobacteraceae bacterium]|nr:alkaline phosphatase family protein [Steroidobacteraceae bacterium]